MCLDYIRGLKLIEGCWVLKSNQLVLHLQQDWLSFEEPILCCVMVHDGWGQRDRRMKCLTLRWKPEVTKALLCARCLCGLYKLIFMTIAAGKYSHLTFYRWEQDRWCNLHKVNWWKQAKVQSQLPLALFSMSHLTIISKKLELHSFSTWIHPMPRACQSYGFSLLLR